MNRQKSGQKSQACNCTRFKLYHIYTNKLVNDTGVKVNDHICDITVILQDAKDLQHISS